MLCIIIPFRRQPQFDRTAQLDTLLRHLRRHMAGPYKVVVVEQADDSRLFNRGALLNIGFCLRGGDTDTVLFHDVDLVPCTMLLRHYRSGDGVHHLGRCWTRYANNPRYLGGVLRMSVHTCTTLNGFPNTFWGWGGEDDDMNLRLEALAVPVSYPVSGTYEDLEKCSLPQKLEVLRQHRLKCMNKWELLKAHHETWRHNGLSNLDFHVQCSEQLGHHAMKYTVDIHRVRKRPRSLSPA